MAKHALLSPSASSRWLNCPGSKHAKSTGSNAAADRGTELHDAAAQALLTGTDPPPEVWEYVEFVRGLDGELHVEKTWESEVVDDFFGTIDACVVSDDEVWVVDLKTGDNPVSSADNDQLKCYLCLVREKFKFPGRKYFGAIVQHGVDITQYTDAELDDHSHRVKLASKSDALKAGSHCRWCPLLSTCQVAYEHAVRIAADIFPEEPEEPTVAQCLDVIGLEPVISEMADRAKKTIRAKLMRGEEVEGWRLGAPLGNRQWDDPAAVESALCDMLENPELVRETKLKSPAQIEKMAGLADFVSQHTVREAKPVIAVPVSSKIPAYEVVNAAEIFAG